MTYPRAGVAFFADSSLLDTIIAYVSADRKAQGMVPAHVALIDPRRALPGADLTQPVLLFETTIAHGKNGAQWNSLDGYLASCGATSHIWLCEFTDPLVQALDWQAMETFARSKAGNRYNIPELPADLFAYLFKLPRKLALLAHSEHAEVCCELLLDDLVAGGLEHFLHAFPFPYGSSPQEVAEMPLFKSCRQLAGPKAALRGFHVSL